MSAGPCRAILHAGAAFADALGLPDFYLVIHNRHLSCVEETQTPIIPVSHD